jgi:RNA polymerase sigma-70 factor, ECF subfamily
VGCAGGWVRLHGVALRETRRVLGPSDEAHDAAQEALTRAFRRGDQLRRTEAAEAWVRAIARREALRLVSRRPQHAELDDDRVASADGWDVAASDPRDRVVEHLDLHRALRTLSPRDRQILFGHYWQGATCAELAAAFDMPEGTVKIRLHRSRHALRRALEG